MNDGQNKIVVDGISYELLHISPRVLKRYFIKTAKIIGPALATLFDQQDMENVDAGKIVSVALKDLEPEQLEDIETLLFSQAFHCGGTYKGQSVEGVGHLAVPVKYDKAFTDKLLHSYSVLFFVMKYYYKDFFVDGVDLLNKIKEVTGSPQTEK